MFSALSRFGLSGRRPDARFAVRAVTAALTVALVVQAVRLVLIFVEPSGAQSAGLSVAAPRPQARLNGFDPFFRNGAASIATATAGAGEGQGITLFGVRAGGGQGGAILAGPDGVQRSYRVGDEVAPGVRLQSVGFDHVILARGGATSRLDFPPSATTYVPPPAAPAQAVQPAPTQPAPTQATDAQAEPSS